MRLFIIPLLIALYISSIYLNRVIAFKIAKIDKKERPDQMMRAICFLGIIGTFVLVGIYFLSKDDNNDSDFWKVK